MLPPFDNMLTLLGALVDLGGTMMKGNPWYESGLGLALSRVGSSPAFVGGESGPITELVIDEVNYDCSGASHQRYSLWHRP